MELMHGQAKRVVTIDGSQCNAVMHSLAITVPNSGSSSRKWMVFERSLMSKAAVADWYRATEMCIQGNSATSVV